MIKRLLVGYLLGVSSLTMFAQSEYNYLSEAKPVEYTYNDYYYQRSSMFKELPVTEGDFIFLGDSLTDGGQWSEMFDNGSVKNRGIISDIVQGVYDRVDYVLKGQPKKIFLMIGVNDVSHHLTNDSIVDAVEKLVVRIKNESPKTDLHLQSCLPINNTFRRYKNIFNKEDSVRIINVLLEQVAEKHDIKWINLYPAFADRQCNLRKELTSDGLHLNEKGYKIWRDRVAKYIDPELKFDDNEPLYKIGNEDFVLVGNSIVRYAEWGELMGDHKVKDRGTGADVVTYLPNLAKTVAKNTPKGMLLLSTFNAVENTPKGLNISPDFDADEIVRKMEQAILAVKEVSPSTVIYLQSLTPVNSTYKKYAGFADKTKAFKNVNKKLKKLAKKHKVVWLDLYPVFADKEGNLKAEFTNDGFHLMGKGYKAWADVLKAALNQ